jgi:hypothetical protein
LNRLSLSFMGSEIIIYFLLMIMILFLEKAILFVIVLYV